MDETFTGWLASLSNGETVLEGEWIEGESSPWRKLLKRLKDDNLTITQLRLQRGGVTVVCIPKSIGYVQASEETFTVFSKTRTYYQGVGSILNDLVFMNWVNDYGEIKQAVYSLDKMYLHSTLQ